jgi:hypothetical protein
MPVNAFVENIAATRWHKTHACTCFCLFAWIWIYEYMDSRIYARVNKWIHVYTHKWVHDFTYIRTLYIYIYIHTYMNSCIYGTCQYTNSRIHARFSDVQVPTLWVGTLRMIVRQYRNRVLCIGVPWTDCCMYAKDWVVIYMAYDSLLILQKDLLYRCALNAACMQKIESLCTWLMTVCSYYKRTFCIGVPWTLHVCKRLSRYIHGLQLVAHTLI